MKRGNIPGLSLVVIKGSGQVTLKNFGYADLENKIPVRSDTLFQLGACSKSFTALAVLRLEAKGLIDIDDPVSKYFPWFFVTHNNRKYPITLRQLLHHTGGIPGGTLSLVPIGDGKGALEQTVRNLVGIELDFIPGEKFRYATINYDVLGAVIQQVSGKTFEEYMAEEVLRPLALHETAAGAGNGAKTSLAAAGYKTGFFSPRQYAAPAFRGNNPAAYIRSNGRDISRWLQVLMGLETSALSPLVRKTLAADERVPPGDGRRSYAMGWFVDRYGKKEISHQGLNPNFSAYIAFRPGEKIGVAVLANSNSRYTGIIGETVLKTAVGESVPPLPSGSEETNYDKAFSIVALIFAIALFFLTVYFLVILFEWFKGKRKYVPLERRKIFSLAFLPATYLPFLLGVYWLPKLMADGTWQTAIVWGPISLPCAVVLFLFLLGMIFLVHFLTLAIPHENKYTNTLPLVVGVSLLPGIGNGIALFILTGSFGVKQGLGFIIYYFLLALFLYAVSYKVSQSELIVTSNSIVLDLRMKLIKKIFATTYQKFEKIDRGRVYSTLDSDISVIGTSALTFVGTITSTMTIVVIFVYLGTVSMGAMFLILGVLSVLVFLLHLISEKNMWLFEASRNARNVFMGLIDGLLNGYKELRLHKNKMLEYEKDIEETSLEFCDKNNRARITFVVVDIIGNSMMFFLLGATCFVFPVLFPGIDVYTLMSYVMILIYLMEPVSNLLNAIPGLIQLQVSWRRVQQFIEDIPSGSLSTSGDTPHREPGVIEKIEARNLVFQYDHTNEHEKFSVGPIDLEAKKGEIIFVVGGNGSGKTTLAKLLTGLYEPDRGHIEINGEKVDNQTLGEYYSTVFSDFYLFEKLYNVDVAGQDALIEDNLKRLELDEKVHIKNRSFSTVNLSGGQRKRLALFLCFLEDRPIYLFDEWAADQDPQFRRFFYRDLLMRMKEKGKIIIAITHDDHYFDVADKIIKLDMGKIDIMEKGKSEKGKSDVQ
ncbi:MAG: cyclic peptide export ABC transporter [bacterium]|nr:cyclic peptide export ABC transporter [bacterium]